MVSRAMGRLAAALRECVMTSSRCEDVLAGAGVEASLAGRDRCERAGGACAVGDKVSLCSHWQTLMRGLSKVSTYATMTKMYCESILKMSR